MGAFSALEIRLIGALVAVFVFFGIGVYLEHRGVQKCEISQAQIVAIQTAAAREQEAKDARTVQDAEDQYREELAKNAGVLAPVPDVRLCLDTGPSPVPQAQSHPSGSPGAPTAARPLPAVARPNVGPKLYADADLADKLSAELRALQLACKGEAR